MAISSGQLNRALNNPSKAVNEKIAWIRLAVEEGSTLLVWHAADFPAVPV